MSGVGHEDQRDAAAREVLAFFTKNPKARSPGTSEQQERFFRYMVTFMSSMQSTVTGCPHVNPARPQPLVWLAGINYLLCGSCLVDPNLMSDLSARYKAGDFPDRRRVGRCDWCLTPTAETGITPHLVGLATSYIAVGFGTCARCTKAFLDGDLPSPTLPC